MFNDVLTKGQCEALVGKLAVCNFPFQCAHGRPSLVPVVELGGGLGSGMRMGREDNLNEQKEVPFGATMRKWKDKKCVAV